MLGVGLSTWRAWRKDNDQPIPELEPRTYHPRYAKVDVARYLANPRKGTPRQRWMLAVGQ